MSDPLRTVCPGARPRRPLDGTTWSSITVVLPAGEKRADHLFLDSDGLLMHVEIQQEPAADMPVRMIEYAVRIPQSPALAGRVRDLVQIVIQVTGPPMAVDYRLGTTCNHVHLLHVPSLDLDDVGRLGVLAPLALVRGGASVMEPVVRAIVAVADRDLRAAMTTLSLYLVPELADILEELARRAGMTDVIEVLRDTDLGRTFIEEGREEGREQVLAELLAARFPSADPDRVRRTAARLHLGDPDGAALAVLTIQDLDPAPGA